MKLITYLKSANRLTHTHLVLRTTFHNKQMMSSSGDLVLSFPSEKIPGEEKNIFHNMYLDLLLVLQFLASDYILNSILDQ